jgi:hypothetical protein
MRVGRHGVSLIAVAGTLLVLLTACAAFEDKPFDGQDEIFYGPEAKPANVDCEKSDALSDLDDFENVWSCEIVLKDGSGRMTNCWARRKSTDSTFGSFTKTCEEWAVELRRTAN